MRRLKSSCAVTVLVLALCVLVRPPRVGANVSLVPAQWTEYHAYSEFVAGLQTLSSSPIAWLDAVGFSVEGRPIWAIKISDNPVTRYIHEDAVVGDILYIDGGQGEVYFEKSMGEKIILVAAGIGIAPIIGILRYIDEVTSAEVSLFQSAPTVEELIYFDKIKRLADSNPRIKYYPSITREESIEGVEEGRIAGERLEKYNVDLSSLFFLSGPGEMIPDLKTYLMSRGVEENRIKYEIWW